MAWNVGEKKGETKRTAASKIVEMRPSGKAGGGESARERDLGGGMEMLELDFLLGVVENIKGRDQNDVMMRKLSFNEVLRRKNLNQLDSSALAIYAVDKGELYGKTIQCEAMKELTKRTTGKS